MYRWRWVIWSVYLSAWTIAILYPVPPQTGIEHIDAVELNRYIVAKSAHLCGYALLAILTGWLRAPLRYRWQLVFVVMAHGTATEMGQWAMREMHMSIRMGQLHDVAYDNVGTLIGVLASWKWWMQEK